MCPWKAAKVTKPTLSLESEALRRCRPASKPSSRHLNTPVIRDAIYRDNHEPDNMRDNWFLHVIAVEF